MSTEFIRSTVFGYIATNLLGIDIQFENIDSIDPSTRTAPYAKVSLRFTSNDQINLGEPALIRQRGAVQVDVYVKQGQGSKSGYSVIDSVSSLLSRKSISNIEFAIPTTLTPLEIAGWHRLTVRAPFYFDS